MYIITIPDILPVCVIKHNVHVDYNAQTSVSILHAVEACSACVCLYIHTTLWCFHNTCIIVHYGAFVIYVWECNAITMHLLHLIPDGIATYGPVYGTWMYSFERFNSWMCRRALTRGHYY